MFLSLAHSGLVQLSGSIASVAQWMSCQLSGHYAHIRLYLKRAKMLVGDPTGTSAVRTSFRSMNIHEPTGEAVEYSC